MSTQTSRPSFVRALRAASPALWPARARLAALKASYKAGTYSGHPEEMLDAIDGVEYRIRRYKDGIRSVKPTPVPVAPVEKQAPVVAVDGLLSELEEFTARGRRTGEPFELGLEASERRLATMKAMYAGKHYRGHPEEMLEDIEVEERRAARLKSSAAQAA